MIDRTDVIVHRRCGRMFVVTAMMLLLILLPGCYPSVVYSPSINLPPRPPRGGSGGAGAGAEMLAEMRPDNVTGSTAGGGNPSVRQAFSDRFSVAAKGWLDLSGKSTKSRSGFSMATIVLLSDSSSNTQWGIINHGAMLLQDGEIEGCGGGTSVIAWLPWMGSWRPYGAVGPFVGIRSTQAGQSNNGEWGWGIMSNFGLSVFALEHLVLNLEVSGMYIRNEYDLTSAFVMSPSAGFSLTW
jgi:hypothetical protein